MALAQLELYHSRPIAPTRRVALGLCHLPTEPAPGWAGVLLGGVAAAHGDDIPGDLREPLMGLINELRDGTRVVQPRLRHRFQTDRVGLLRSRFRLVAVRGELTYRFDDRLGTGLQYLLGAVYAAGRLGADQRGPVFDAIRMGLLWTGRIDSSLVAHLGGSGTGRFDDPVGWALEVLGFTSNGRPPDRSIITGRFRHLLRDAHPDHGGATDEAADRIADLREARRILSLPEPVRS